MMSNCKEMCCGWCAKWRNSGLGLLILRIALGGIFLSAGAQKWSDMDATIGFFARLNLSAFWAYVVATVELVGGLLMILGVGTCITGALLAIIMVVVMFISRAGLPAELVGGARWLAFINNNIIHISLLGSALAVIFTGPGKYSLTAKLKKSCGNAANCAHCSGK